MASGSSSSSSSSRSTTTASSAGESLLRPPVSYSPRLRTAVVLTGTGTAGAYHAGVLKALTEAGVKIDVAAGRGIGAAGAMLAAVDAGSRLWDPDGLWGPLGGVTTLYRWRRMWRLAGWALLVAFGALALPVALLVLGAFLYPFALILQIVHLDGNGVVARWFVELLATSFRRDLFVTYIPRLAVLSLLVALLGLAWEWLHVQFGRRARRRSRGQPWWLALGAPLDASRARTRVVAAFWQFVRGAAAVAQPGRREISRRYSELLVENLGQPGARELILTCHDLDTHRDLIFALLQEPHRRRFFRDDEAGLAGRGGELVDLAGIGRDHVFDAVAGALAVPMIAEPHLLTFAPDSAWRGEPHRLADRPGGLVRLLEEVSAAGAEQVILVSAAPPLQQPHQLASRRVHPRAWAGEYLASIEAAAVRDATTALFDRFSALFHVQPGHNPLGPFDFGGAYDERSDRRHTLHELMQRGYEDAYREFIVPVVGNTQELRAELWKLRQEGGSR